MKDFLKYLLNIDAPWREEKTTRNTVIFWVITIGAVVLLFRFSMKMLAMVSREELAPWLIAMISTVTVLIYGIASLIPALIFKMLDYRWYKTEWPKRQEAKNEEKARLIYHCAKVLAAREMELLQSEFADIPVDGVGWRDLLVFNDINLGCYVEYYITESVSELILLMVDPPREPMEISGVDELLEMSCEKIVFMCSGREIVYYKPGEWQNELFWLMKKYNYFGQEPRTVNIHAEIPGRYAPSGADESDFEEYNQEICRKAHELTHSARGGNAEGEFGRTHYYVSNRITEEILVVTYQSCPSIFLSETVDIYDLGGDEPKLMFRSVLGHNVVLDDVLWDTTGLRHFQNAYADRNSSGEDAEQVGLPLISVLRRFELS